MNNSDTNQNNNGTISFKPIGISNQTFKPMEVVNGGFDVSNNTITDIQNNIQINNQNNQPISSQGLQPVMPIDNWSLNEQPQKNNNFEKPLVKPADTPIVVEDNGEDDLVTYEDDINLVNKYSLNNMSNAATVPTNKNIVPNNNLVKTTDNVINSEVKQDKKSKNSLKLFNFVKDNKITKKKFTFIDGIIIGLTVIAIILIFALIYLVYFV